MVEIAEIAEMDENENDECGDQMRLLLTDA